MCGLYKGLRTTPGTEQAARSGFQIMVLEPLPEGQLVSLFIHGRTWRGRKGRARQSRGTDSAHWGPGITYAEGSRLLGESLTPRGVTRRGAARVFRVVQGSSKYLAEVCVFFSRDGP